MGALAKDIMGGGTSAGQAKAINGRVATGISAAGTALSDATQLSATTNVLGTVASGAGVKLFNGDLGDEQLVYNGGANQCLVYPHAAAGIINQIAAGGAMVLPQYTSCLFRRTTSTNWVAHMSG